ncbi:MAG: MMPL family transporter, partial [Acetobacteraceae bacterium]
MTLAYLLGRLVDWSQRRAVAVVVLALIAAGLGAAYSTTHLGISTDTDAMFPATLPWRQHAIALERAFPQFQSLLVVVVDSRIPEAAGAAAAQLTRALAVDHAHFQGVRDPGALPFFGKEGLLFLPKDKLEALLNRMISAQPLLGQLVADPTGRGLFS